MSAFQLYRKNTLQLITILITDKYPKQLLCDLRKIKIEDGGVRNGWTYPKNSMLRPLFDKIILKQYETGVGQARIRTYFEPEPNECDTASKTSAIGYDLVSTIFFFLIIGAGGTSC
jgi:hypothetical protein